jgi:hypothetical protein
VELIGSVPLAGPVGHWTLDDGAGTVALDSAGTNDGTLIGNLPWIEGVLGGALEFDGESYVDCGKDPSLDITGPISIALWIRPDTDGNIETAPLAKADTGWSYQLRYGWATATPNIMGFQFNATDGSRVWVWVNQELLAGEWYHITGAYDGTTVKCYLDGVETDSAPMAGFAGSASSFLIGSDGWRSDWVGAIDDVRLYDRGLSADEIADIAAGL